MSQPSTLETFPLESVASAPSPNIGAGVITSSSSGTSLDSASDVSSKPKSNASKWASISLATYAHMDLVALVQQLVLRDQLPWESLPEFFSPLKYAVRAPTGVLQTDVDPFRVLSFNYLDSNRRWRDRWALEMRGSVLLHQDGAIQCIKSLLPRGSEVLTYVHAAAGVKQTEDVNGAAADESGHSGISIREEDQLDDEQQETMRLLLQPDAPMSGFASMKRDGMLIGIILVPKQHQLAKTVIRIIQTQDAFARGWYEIAAADESVPFLPIVCTQRTLFASDNTQPYIVTSMLGGHFGVSRQQMMASRVSVSPPQTPWQMMKPYVQRYLGDLTHLLGQASFSDHWHSDSIMCLSFEAICSGRTTAWSLTPMNELAVSYEEDLFSFIGFTHSIGQSCGKYLPHACVTIDSSMMFGRFSEPHAWRIKNAADVHRIIQSLDLVLTGDLTEAQLRERLSLPPSASIDYEGIVLLRATSEHGFSYSKVKSTAYYKAHKLRSNNIEYLSRLSETAARVLPIVKVVQEVIRTGVDRMANLCHQLNLEFFDPTRNSVYLAKITGRVAESFATKSRHQQCQLVMKSAPSAFKGAARALFQSSFKCCLTQGDNKRAVQVESLVSTVLEAIQPFQYFVEPFGKEVPIELHHAVDEWMKTESPIMMMLIKIMDGISR